MTRSNFRSRARARTLRALYQWQITGDDTRDILKQSLEDKCDRREAAYFESLFLESSAAAGDLDALAEQYLDRPLAQIDPVERAVLWIGLLECRDHVEIPYRVVINEAVELAKCYGAEAGHKYINAVLDRATRDMRAGEWTNSR
jgi:N utilization substance protein B